MRLRDKVAIVTGGGSGIGKAIAELFAAAGAKLVVASRNLQALEQTAREIRSSGGAALAVQADLTVEEQVRHLVHRCVDDFGGVDILVNNSAAMIPDEVEVADMTLDHWNKVLGVNLTGTMLCCREALQVMMPKRTGSIVNVSSIAGVIGNPKRSPYSASKWAVNGLTETLAIEAGPHNIRVNSLSPAATRTERFEAAVRARAERFGTSFEDLMAKILSHYSMRRLAEPMEVAKAALFLASDESSAITGQNLIVSCGFHMLNPTEIR